MRVSICPISRDAGWLQLDGHAKWFTRQQRFTFSDGFPIEKPRASGRPFEIIGAGVAVGKRKVRARLG